MPTPHPHAERDYQTKPPEAELNETARRERMSASELVRRELRRITRPQPERDRAALSDWRLQHGAP
jgi:hypothetical protein